MPIQNLPPAEMLGGQGDVAGRMPGMPRAHRRRAGDRP